MSMQIHLFILTISIHVHDIFYICVCALDVCLVFFLFHFQNPVSSSVVREPGNGIGRKVFSVCSSSRVQHVLQPSGNLDWEKILSSPPPGESIELNFGLPGSSAMTCYVLKLLKNR